MLHRLMSSWTRASSSLQTMFKLPVLLRIVIVIIVVIILLALLRIDWKSPYQASIQLNMKSWVNESDSRTKELKILEDLVQRRLLYLQNPKSCSSAKKVLCRFSGKVGYGSQMNDWIFCLIVAYATQRTLIIESRGWRYATGGLETTFLPISTTCTSIYNEKAVLSYDLRNISGIKVVQLPRNMKVRGANRPNYLPLSIPEDLADDLIRLHRYPPGWWIGQFLVYLTRPKQDVKLFIESAVKTSGFRHPIVGIHVRRTDKKAEAPYKELTEYMKYVEEWFDKYEITHGIVSRNVFLASDDPNVVMQAEQSYKSYTFVTNMNASMLAQERKSRYSESSLLGIILDIEMLSMCDYVVCTFSSNVGNIVYELMQVRYWDAPSRIKSLDIGFSFLRLVTQKRKTQKAKNVQNATGIVLSTNVSKEKQATSVSFDIKQSRVKMPTYPDVPRLSD